MSSSFPVDRELDLSEQGCGQLVMEIMLAMRPLVPDINTKHKIDRQERKDEHATSS